MVKTDIDRTITGRTSSILFLTLFIIGLFLSFTISYNVTTNLVYVDPDEPYAEWDVIIIDGFNQTTFRDIEFINETHGWLVGRSGEGGAILYTTDSGITWTVLHEFEGAHPVCVSVIDSNDIWMGCEGRLLHSVDGGASWDIERLIDSYSHIEVEFYNASYGWFGCHNRLSVTDDGGVTWQTFDDWPDVYINDIIVTPLIVRIATSSGIYLSNDVGITWTLEYDKRTDSISFVDDDTIWTEGYRAISSFDGDIWTEQPAVSRLSNWFTPAIYDIEFLDDKTGWIAGSCPAIAYTLDGGLTWYDQLTDDYHIVFYALDTYNESLCWAAGFGVVARTITGNLYGPPLYRGFYLRYGMGGWTIPYEPFLAAVCISSCFSLITLYYWKKYLRRKV